jgi:argininosuccinate synthase
MKKEVKKVVLAYSGGLDTSVILKWLQDEYKCEVVTFTADIGQGEEVEPARAKAVSLGIKPENIYIEDFAKSLYAIMFSLCFARMRFMRVNTFLGTSIARPLIAKRQAEIARITGADAVSHGATGKGNDQVRFEMGYLGQNSALTIIAPWREWDLNSSEKLACIRCRARDKN